MKDWAIGEKELLVELHKKLGNIGLSWRDDCIIRQINPDLCIAYSIDSSRRWLSHNEGDDAVVFGKWVASTIVSDVIACGVTPCSLALDVGLGAFHGMEDTFRFFDGVLDVCREYGVSYEGGNLNRTKLVSGVSWGMAHPSQIISREGAQKDSVLLATAPIGVGWASELLRIWRKKRKEADLSLPESFASFVTSYKQKSTINLPAFQEIWKTNTIDCGMDLTDGILEFAYEIHDRTGLGIIIDPDKVHPFVSFMAAQLKISPVDIMLDPGYDTPLSHGWCIKKENLNAVVRILCQHNVPYTIMGEVTDQVNGVFRKADNSFIELPRFWDDKCREADRFQMWEKSILPKGKLIFPREMNLDVSSDE